MLTGHTGTEILDIPEIECNPNTVEVIDERFESYLLPAPNKFALILDIYQNQAHPLFVYPIRSSLILKQLVENLLILSLVVKITYGYLSLKTLTNFS